MTLADTAPPPAAVASGSSSALQPPAAVSASDASVLSELNTVLRCTMRCADGEFHDVLALKTATDKPYDFLGMYRDPTDPDSQPEPVIGALRASEGHPILAMAARREGRWVAVGAGRRPDAGEGAPAVDEDFRLAFEIEGKAFVAKMRPGMPDKAMEHFGFEGRPAARAPQARRGW